MFKRGLVESDFLQAIAPPRPATKAEAPPRQAKPQKPARPPAPPVAEIQAAVDQVKARAPRAVRRPAAHPDCKKCAADREHAKTKMRELRQQRGKK